MSLQDPIFNVVYEICEQVVASEIHSWALLNYLVWSVVCLGSQNIVRRIVLWSLIKAFAEILSFVDIVSLFHGERQRILSF